MHSEMFSARFDDDVNNYILRWSVEPKYTACVQCVQHNKKKQMVYTKQKINRKRCSSVFGFF